MFSNKTIGYVGGAACLLWACGAAEQGGGEAPSGVQPQTPPPNGGPVTSGPAAGPGVGATTPPVAGAPAGQSPVGQEGQGQVGLVGGASAGLTALPCDVATILSDHCSTCHGATPQFNAPMSLVSVSDFSAEAPVSGQPVQQAVLRRVTAEGNARMPPPGTVDALEPAEIATLSAWLEGGAGAVANGCEVGVLSVPQGPGDIPDRPAEPGTTDGPYKGWDEGVTCYPFTAFAQGGNKQEPYKVGSVVDEYIGFGFTPPWQGTRYVRAFRAVVDNAQVLHHWILFKEPGTADGSVAPIAGAHPGGEMMMGWAPGGTDQYFTPDLGMRMDGSESFLLEIHYNSSDPQALDASGLEICVSEDKPENEAIVHWLGTDAINGTRASGTCNPVSNETIHIVGGNPHMHLKGAAMQVAVNRADGSTEMVHDAPFSFDNQRGYPANIVINPGDTITTTCSYSSPATFGRGTNEEMCYWFALAYPAGALTDNGIIGRLVHGENACLGL